MGQFQALVSSWSADREKDTIDRHAFDQSIADWKASGKMLPLLFEHTTTAIGGLDPASMSTDERGLIVSGEVDRETPEGAQAWKQIKNGSASFSIGFMATKSRPREGGGRELLEIDLLEVSVVSTPMHPDTRALSWKTADQHGMGESEFDAMIARNRKHDEQFRQHWRRKLRDRELEQMIEEVNAKKARDELRDRPIKFKRFEVG